MTTINFVTIPDTLLESELFGYEKGVLPGGTHRRVGKIEQVGRAQFFWTKSANSPTPFKGP